MAPRKRKSHLQVEFTVDNASGREQTYSTFAEASAAAVAVSASTGQGVDLNVLIYSKAGARWRGGDHAVEEYEADPDASVSEQISITAESHGRIA